MVAAHVCNPIPALGGWRLETGLVTLKNDSLDYTVRACFKRPRGHVRDHHADWTLLGHGPHPTLSIAMFDKPNMAEMEKLSQNERRQRLERKFLSLQKKW